MGWKNKEADSCLLMSPAVLVDWKEDQEANLYLSGVSSYHMGLEENQEAKAHPSMSQWQLCVEWRNKKPTCTPSLASNSHAGKKENQESAALP